MKHYHKYFGSTLVFPQTYNVDSPLADDIQPPGNQMCVIYSIDDICQDKLGFDIDKDELYARVPHGTNGGTDPHTVIQEVLDNGIKWESTGIPGKPFLSSFVADTDSPDHFDSVRSAILQEKCSIIAWGQWNETWGTSSVMGMPSQSSNYHCVSVKGWDIINGEPQLIIEAHVGRFLYASRSVFNAWAKTPYFGTAILSEKPIASLMEKLINALTSLIGLLKKKDMNNLLWDTKENIRHSVRVICDQEGLTVNQKNTLCATVEAESGFNLHAINYNYAFRLNGTKYVSSTDRGIAQWNDYWHGKEITPDEAFNNPEKCIRLMCTYWKNGQMKQWCAYNNGSYKRFL